MSQGSGVARSNRHNHPGKSREGPDQTVTVGPNQPVITSRRSGRRSGARGPGMCSPARRGRTGRCRRIGGSRAIARRRRWSMCRQRGAARWSCLHGATPSSARPTNAAGCCLDYRVKASIRDAERGRSPWPDGHRPRSSSAGALSACASWRVGSTRLGGAMRNGRSGG